MRAHDPTVAPLLHPIPVACRMLGVGRTWLYEKIKAGEIVVVRLGKSVRIEDEEVRRVIAANRRGGA